VKDPVPADPTDNLLTQLALSATYKGLNVRITEMKHDWICAGVTATGHFHYVAFKDGVPTIDEFVNLVYQRIIGFCLPRTYVQECLNKIKADDDQTPLYTARDKAVELFIKAKGKCATAGEPGEVLLYMLLEAILGAPRLVSKMSLKTNTNMEIYGTDSIHMKFNPHENSLYLYWGESKVYSELTASFTEMMRSITNFYTPNELGELPKSRDISLIENYSDITDTATLKVMSDYLNPYNEKYNNTKEIHACLACWDYDIYTKVQAESHDKREKLFIEKYSQRIKSACENFVEKIKDHKLERLRFHLFLLPVPNTETFRKQFYKKLGIQI
jgi:hypothetical protein